MKPISGCSASSPGLAETFSRTVGVALVEISFSVLRYPYNELPGTPPSSSRWHSCVHFLVGYMRGVVLICAHARDSFRWLLTGMIGN